MGDIITLTTINEEPRVLDTDLAEALGLARSYDIRELIARNGEELSGYGDIPYRTENTGRAGRPGSRHGREQGRLPVSPAPRRGREAAGRPV